MRSVISPSQLPLIALVALIGIAGCRRGGASAGVSDSTFVAAIAELHAINADTSLDSTARAAARRRVLQERGVTGDALERAARAMAEDPEHALAVWTAIDHRVRDTTTRRPTNDSSAKR